MSYKPKIHKLATPYYKHQITKLDKIPQERRYIKTNLCSREILKALVSLSN